MVCVRKACESLSVFSKDLCKTRYTMYKRLWYPSLKPFFYAIKVIGIGVFCDCSDKCHLQSKELLAMICQRSLLAPSERVFHFFLVFFENLPR